MEPVRRSRKPELKSILANGGGGGACTSFSLGDLCRAGNLRGGCARGLSTGGQEDPCLSPDQSLGLVVKGSLGESFGEWGHKS